MNTYDQFHKQFTRVTYCPRKISWTIHTLHVRSLAEFSKCCIFIATAVSYGRKNVYEIDTWKTGRLKILPHFWPFPGSAFTKPGTCTIQLFTVVISFQSH
jgi:hypothetical protein